MLPSSIPSSSTRRQLLRAGLAAAVGSWATFELLGSARADAAQTPAAPAKARISMVGDSLTCGTMPFQADEFSTVGWSHSAIDAYVSRGVRTKVKADRYTGLTAVDAIREKSGDTEAWVIALGTNDAVLYNAEKAREVIHLMMDHIGPGHRVLWVNVYMPKALPKETVWNTALDDVAAQRPTDMFVYDWASFAAENQRWLAHDHMHYSRDGYRYRSTAVGLTSRYLLPDASGLGAPRSKASRSDAPH